MQTIKSLNITTGVANLKEDALNIPNSQLKDFLGSVLRPNVQLFASVEGSLTVISQPELNELFIQFFGAIKEGGSINVHVTADGVTEAQVNSTATMVGFQAISVC